MQLFIQQFKTELQTQKSIVCNNTAGKWFHRETVDHELASMCSVVMFLTHAVKLAYIWML